MHSFQDTVLAEEGDQFYGFCYIEGAIDFIFGQHARAFFHKNVIASLGAGALTANGPSDASDDSICQSNISFVLNMYPYLYHLSVVINESNITTSSAASVSLTGQVFLGRPWTQFAR